MSVGSKQSSNPFLLFQVSWSKSVHLKFFPLRELRLTLFLKILCFVSIAVLVVSLFLRPGSFFQAGFSMLICLAAAVVLLEKARTNHKVWAGVFGVIALMFTPFFPLERTGASIVLLEVVALLAFLTLAFFPAMSRMAAERLPAFAQRKAS
jgi:hypothetical protein